jgi:hypothetical protein
MNLVSPANSRLWERARAAERDQNYGRSSFGKENPKRNEILPVKRDERSL